MGSSAGRRHGGLGHLHAVSARGEKPPQPSTDRAGPSGDHRTLVRSIGATTAGAQRSSDTSGRHCCSRRPPEDSGNCGGGGTVLFASSNGHAAESCPLEGDSLRAIGHYCTDRGIGALCGADRLASTVTEDSTARACGGDAVSHRRAASRRRASRAGCREKRYGRRSRRARSVPNRVQSSRREQGEGDLAFRRRKSAGPRLRSTRATGGRPRRMRREGRRSTCGGSVSRTVKLRPACGEQGRTCRGKTMGLHAAKNRRELDHRSR